MTLGVTPAGPTGFKASERASVPGNWRVAHDHQDGGLSFARFAPFLIVAGFGVAALFVLRFVSEGALIEGIARIRKGGGTMTTREGFRAGWAHWGVLFRIALVYFAAVAGSLGLLAVPCLIAFRAFGVLGGLALLVPALVVGLPWLVTLYLVQAFAMRIAVLDNRRALDAIAKARLFLHGRIMHGLKIIVAALVGTLAIAIPAIVVLAPVVLALVALGLFVAVLPAVAIGCVVVLPVLVVVTAITGTFRSSIWTIGYVTQAES